jgi:catechol 2,3-dioxygenase-like lactoylglutathione lyase family enzyme
MMRVEHVRLLVVKFAECFRFYRDIIGLTVIWGNEADDYASFSEGDQKEPNLALFRRQSMAEALGIGQLPSETPSQDRSMLIISVMNVDDVVKRFQSQGVQFVLGPQNFPDWGMRSAYLRDPEGNLIELCGELPKENWSAELRQAAEKYAST